MVKKIRTEGDFIKIDNRLLPLSWLYGVGVNFRNWLFEVGVLKSHSFHIPVISVGNITVGGSGKTPHVEYLIRLLHDKVKVAVLSRGYKRKSSGYILADDSTSMRDIGDEPFQIHKKFSDIYMAVDKNRCHGIDRLINDNETKDVGAILLDDAYQHRYVKPGINILLVDYHRLIVYDKLLPAGLLREPQKEKNRADIVIVTKCPKDLRPMEFRVLTKAMNLYPYQDLFFTTLEYGNAKAIFTNETIKLEDLNNKHILLLTGIASPKQIVHDLKIHRKQYTPLTYPDHHNFTKKDVTTINETFASMPQPKIIITTEKDAARLNSLSGLSQNVINNIFALPIEVSFMDKEQEETFKNKIINYVRKD